MKNETIQTVKTFCPIFNGFYNSIWEDDIDSNYECEIEYYTNELKKEITEDDIECDTQGYYLAVAKSIPKNVMTLINEYIDGLITDIEYEELISPKFYNYTNDSINVKISIDTQKLHNYLYDNDYENYDKLGELISNRYKSRKGFFPSFSDDIEEWERITKEFTDFSKTTHELGAVLDMIAEIENIQESSLWEMTNDYVCVSEFFSIKDEK